MEAPRIRALILSPREAMLLDLDVGGAPAGSYLRASLASHDVDVKVGAAADLGSDGDSLLVVDARAWLSTLAIERIVTRIREDGGSFRVTVTRAGQAPGGAPVSTLAAYFASQSDRSLLNPASAMREDDGSLEFPGFEGIPAIAAAGLDPDEPALLIRRYADLAGLEDRVLFQRAMRAMDSGVRVRDPKSLYIRGELICGSGVEIDVNVVIDGKVTLGDSVRVGANCMLRAVRVGERTVIHPFTLVEDARIGANASIGPYARVRPGSEIGDAVQIGNYVEVKNSQIGDGSRINHHAFVGDATLADHVTVGAGTITCNHDGARVNRTLIGRGAYVGSGCCLVAPLRIGEGATIGAGSTITRDAPPDQLTLSRSPQKTVESWRRPKPA